MNLSDTKNNKVKKFFRVLGWSVVVALGGFLFGFDTAVISGVEKSIEALFGLEPFWHGFTISSALIGTVAGALLAGKPADRFGRKPVLIVIAALYLVSAFGSATSELLGAFITYRFLGGLAVGASSVVGPMYIAEISPAGLRGRMTALFQFNVITGIMMAYVSNYLLRDTGLEPWRWMLGVESIPAAIFLLLLFFIPGSPRFLVKKGRLEEARRILGRIETGSVDQRMDEIRESLEQAGNANGKLFSRIYMKPISIAFLVAMFNQFSGINAILYYAPRIFELSGMDTEDSLYQSVMIGVTNAVFTMAGMFAIDRVGRKKLLIVGSLGMSVCLGLISRTFFNGDIDGNILLVFLLVYIMFFAFSTGTVIWVLIAEVFPNRVRGQGQSLGSFTHWFFAALVTWFFPFLVGRFEAGVGISFAVFSAMTALQMFVVWLYFPETKGKTLESLEKELLKKK
jgi:sugar porter (SP) family MFS transporter